MKVEVKLYKTFDSDLISLNTNGISVSALIKLALYHKSRGENAKFYVKECKPFDLAGVKRYVHIVANITDEKSIAFLKKEIKSRERSAFIRALLRDCLVMQQLGVYLKNPETIQKETERCLSLNLEGQEHVYVLEFHKRKHDYASEILRPAGSKPKGKKVKKDDDKPRKNRFRSERFGDVSDLALAKDKKEELAETVQVQEEIPIPKMDPSIKKPGLTETPVDTTPLKSDKELIGEDDAPWDEMDEAENTEAAEVETDAMTTEEKNDEAMAAFQGLLDFDFDME